MEIPTAVAAIRFTHYDVLGVQCAVDYESFFLGVRVEYKSITSGFRFLTEVQVGIFFHGFSPPYLLLLNFILARKRVCSLSLC